MSGYLCFQIELTRGYDYSAFREDLKKLYNSAGVEGKNTVFLFTDTQVDNIWYFAVFPNLYSCFKIRNGSTLHSLLHSVDQIFVNCSICFHSYFPPCPSILRQIVVEEFLEDINNILNSGEVRFPFTLFFYYFFKQSLKYSLIVHKGKKNRRNVYCVFKSDKDKAKLWVQLFRPK